MFSQPTLAPFRLSKLTKLFQSFLVGDGKVVRHFPPSCLVLIR